MADAALLVKAYLAQNADLMNLLGRYKVRVGDLPEKFDPELGACITIMVEGGRAHPEGVPIPIDRVKLRIWCARNNYQKARAIYQQVSTWLHAKNQIAISPFGTIMSSQESARGSNLTDPTTGWATVVAFYEVRTHD